MDGARGDVVRLATVSRDGVVESTHYGRVAIAGPDGRLLAGVGNSEGVQFWRSSSKPIQALSVVTSGAADRFELSERELAICCASHRGSQEHVETVRGILRKLDLDESALQCGTHWPGDTDERNRLVREGREPSPLHNNCSGKHAGMLATCLALGADVASYPEREHPVQRLIAVHLSVLSRTPDRDFVFGRDGCGLPTVAMPLSAMARAYARLGAPEGLPGELATAAERITSAMLAAPAMISGEGAFNTELLAHGKGDVIAKGGAEGLFCIAMRRPAPRGIAFKISDGSGRAQGPIAIALLQRLGAELDPGLVERFGRIEVGNCHNEIVGQIEPCRLDLDMMA